MLSVVFLILIIFNKGDNIFLRTNVEKIGLEKV